MRVRVVVPVGRVLVRGRRHIDAHAHVAHVAHVAHATHADAANSTHSTHRTAHRQVLSAATALKEKRNHLFNTLLHITQEHNITIYKTGVQLRLYN